MCDQIYKRIDDNLRKDAGCGSEPIIAKRFRWSTWIVPKKNGEKDLSKTLTGDILKVLG